MFEAHTWPEQGFPPPPRPCRGRLEGNPAVLGLVATFSSIFSVCLDDLCFVCGLLACKMIKSGSKNETPRGGVTEDSLSQSLPFSTSRSLPPRSSLRSPPSCFFTSSLLFLYSLLLFSSLLCEPSGHRSIPSAGGEEEGGLLWEMGGTSSSQ